MPWKGEERERGYYKASVVQYGSSQKSYFMPAINRPNPIFPNTLLSPPVRTAPTACVTPHRTGLPTTVCVHTGCPSTDISTVTVGRSVVVSTSNLDLKTDISANEHGRKRIDSPLEVALMM